MLEPMDTFISLGLLAVVLVPLYVVVRDLMRTPGSHAAPLVREPFYETTSTMSTFPSLATLRQLEDTAPSFVKQQEWRKE